MPPVNIWIEQCEAARSIEAEIGTDKAIAYLIGEKFLNFLEAAEGNAGMRAEIPAFVAEVKRIFERWQWLSNWRRSVRLSLSIQKITTIPRRPS